MNSRPDNQQFICEKKLKHVGNFKTFNIHTSKLATLANAFLRTFCMAPCQLKELPRNKFTIIL